MYTVSCQERVQFSKLIKYKTLENCPAFSSLLDFHVSPNIKCSTVSNVNLKYTDNPEVFFFLNTICGKIAG